MFEEQRGLWFCHINVIHGWGRKMKDKGLTPFDENICHRSAGSSSMSVFYTQRRAEIILGKQPCASGVCQCLELIRENTHTRAHTQTELNEW